MKIRNFLLFFLFSIAFSGSGVAAVSYEMDTVNGILHVEGRGYPPVHSENIGEARLMAKRAAVLDAYRNVLALIGAKKEHSLEEVELAVTYGYVRGAKVIHEILLSDGGVLVTLAYPLSDEEMSRFGQKRTVRENSGDRRAGSDSHSSVLSGPVVVDLETWIQKLKDERRQAEHSRTSAVPSSKKPIQVQGVHPVTLEEWISIVTEMRRR